MRTQINVLKTPALALLALSGMAACTAGQAQTYSVITIPAVQPGNYLPNPFAVNDRGQVVGDGQFAPFLYDRANGTGLLPLFAGGSGGQPLAPNHHEQGGG